MSMPDLTALIFDIVGCMNLVFIIVLILIKDKRNACMKRLFSASAFHFFSVFCDTAKIIDNVFGQQVLGKQFTGISAVLDIISLGAIMICVFSDQNGVVSIHSWKSKFFPAKLPSLVMPFLTALGFEMIFKEYHFIDFGYTFSFYLFYIIIQRATEENFAMKEAQVSSYQARLLTEQIQPHFIFNSLMSIEDLCYTDPGKAAKCIEDFAGYLRGNIDAFTSEAPISFMKELKHIKQYVSLERARNGVGFEITYDLKETEFDIPALTIQPIVENAIKHGALSRRDGTGKVSLSTEKIGNFIKVIVEDNGIKTQLTPEQQEHKSIGLDNVKERLKTQCGGSLELNITGDGARAVIVVPAGEKNEYSDGR